MFSSHVQRQKHKFTPTKKYRIRKMIFGTSDIFSENQSKAFWHLVKSKILWFWRKENLRWWKRRGCGGEQMGGGWEGREGWSASETMGLQCRTISWADQDLGRDGNRALTLTRKRNKAKNQNQSWKKLNMKLEDNLASLAGGLKVEEGLGCVRKA